MSGGTCSRAIARCRVAGALALCAPLVVLPATATAAPAAERSAWWCAPDAALRADVLPDVLPAAACGLAERTVVGPSGFGVAVPPVGRAVTGTARFPDHVEVVSVWTDEYGVHVRGDEYAAADGYLGAIGAHAAGGDGDRADLGRMAQAVRRLTYGATGRVRPQPVPVSTLLAAADTLVAAFDGEGGAPPAAVGTAAATLRSYLALAATRDDAPSLAELLPMIEAVRAALRAPALDAATAERALTDAVTVHVAAISLLHSDPTARTLTTAVDVLGRLVAALREAADPSRPLPAPPSGDTEAYETALADLSGHVGRYVPEGSPSVPQVSEPGIGNPAGGTTSGAAPHPCSDGARSAKYADRGHWRRGFVIPWYYNHANRYPAYYAEDYAAALQRAFDNLTDLDDDCGYSWRPNIGNGYVGYATQTSVQPLADGRCQRLTDRKNIVAWLSLDAQRMLARTCTYRASGVGDVDGFDIAIGRRTRWDVAEANYAMGDWCEQYAPDEEYDFEAALTHEFGHALALGHVDEAAHGNLTMSTMINGACNEDERSPGYGDAVGLAVLYGRT